MELLWYLGAAWIAYVYVGYPVLVALWGFLRGVRPRSRDDYLPTVSVLIAARNEARDIEWKLRQTLEWDYPPERLEVLVASDASDDGTDQIVQQFSDSRVRVLRLEQRGGKVRALNRLRPLARGEILFFTDANASIGAACLRRMVRHFADPKVGCVTGVSRPLPKVATGAVSQGAAAYWSYESWVARLESRCGAVVACDGAIHCVRRQLCPPLLPELANDFELPLRIRHAGYWVLVEPEAVAIEKETESVVEEFARRRRIAAQGALAMWKLRKLFTGVLVWQLVSHKLLRWLTVVPLALLLISSIRLADHGGFAAALVAQVLFYSAAAGGLVGIALRRDVPRLLAIPLYTLTGVFATVVGVLDAVAGRYFVVWESARLSRGAPDARL